MKRPIYFDYNATTPIDEGVLESMLPFFQTKFGNSSSNTHLYGWEADMTVKKARKQIASYLEGNCDNIIFTSGATESNNMVFYSLSQALKSKGNHLITSSIEHTCVLNCCKYLESLGYEVTYIPVDSNGFINPLDIEEAIRPTTILISIMAANNEIGTIQPIDRIGKIAQEHDIFFHTDASQVIGKYEFSLQKQHVDFVSASAHKMYGPKGIGLLYAKETHLLQAHPLIKGGGQEKGMRSGTLNVPNIVGFAKAFEISARTMDKDVENFIYFKQYFLDYLRQHIPEIKLNGSLENSLPGTLNIALLGFNSVQLLSHLKNKFALSTGSACTSLNQEYSHVLKSIGCTESEGKCSLRISFGRFTQMEDVKNLACEIVNYVSSINLKNNEFCTL